MEIKEIKFKTNKGEFILVDMIGQTRRFIPWDFVEKSYNVKGISEEEASEIVETFESESIDTHRCCLLSTIEATGGDDYTNPVILKLK